MDATIDIGQREAAWAAQARRGDADAMQRLVDLHRIGLRRMTANLLRDSHLAEDVVQEAFLKAFRELPKLRDDSLFRSYLFRIAARICIDRLRRAHPTSDEVDPPVAPTAPRVLETMMVERVLATLPAEARVVIVLREIEGLSYEEIAEVVGIPVGTVRSRLHVARERFRRAWTEMLES